jgi:nucleotide-binding universal stress UspA family protein
VVAAIDFSPASIRAAEAALLVVDEGAHITLLHVAPEFVFGELLADASKRAVSVDVAHALDRLRDELYRFSPADVRIDLQIVAGGVVDGVLAQVADARADLIAAGTHGPNVLERFFIGSVAGILLHVAPTSVLASPAPDPLETARRHAMTVVTERPEEWSAVLQSISERNLSRRVIVEVDDPEFGAQVQAHGYLFQGAAWDPVDARVDVMLGAVAGGMTHLTRSIRGVASIGVSRVEQGKDRALELRHGSGHTLLIFEH